MFGIFLATGISLIVGSTVAMVKTLNAHDLVPKKKAKEDKITYSLPFQKALPAKEENIINVQFTEVPEEPVINSDMEKKLAELLIQNDLYKAKLNEKEEEDKRVAEEVQKLMAKKKDNKKSNLAAELFSDGK